MNEGEKMKIVGVRFREVGKIYYYRCKDDSVAKGDKIIAETKLGLECGTVLNIKDMHKNSGDVPEQYILRKATEKDLKSLEIKRSEEIKALKICKEKVLHHKLKMKLIDSEYTFDRGKLIFYFVSDARVDFRNLVKDLAYIFKVRIELRQVGIRDEAKLLGGLGPCGKEFCCSGFLNDFQSVSIKMAKDQQLSLNPVKLSGSCGRLMCCLKYEQGVYKDILNRMPKVGAAVKSGGKDAVVVGRNVLAETLDLELAGSDEEPVRERAALSEVEFPV